MVTHRVSGFLFERRASEGDYNRLDLAGMESRSSYMAWKNQKTAQRDRTTYNPHSNNKFNEDKPERSTEQMITTILDMMARLDRRHSNQVYSRELLKQGSKQVFFDTAAALLAAIDTEEELVQLDQDMLMELLDILEYDGTVNRNIFMPIGAPHTWCHCLAILQFLAHVAHYTYNIDQEAEEEHFAEDLNSLIIKTCQTQDQKVFEKFEAELLQKAQADLKELQIQIEQQDMLIDQIDASQPQLAEIENQLHTENNRLSQVQFELRQAQEETAESKRVLRELQGEKTRLQEELQLSDREIANAEYEITHQECTPQEQARAEAELRELQRKKEVLREQGKQRVERFKDNTNRVMQRISEKVAELATLGKALGDSPLTGFPSPPTPPQLQPYQLVDQLSEIKYGETLPDLSKQVQRIREAFRINQVRTFVDRKRQYEQQLQRKCVALESQLTANQRSTTEIGVVHDSVVSHNEQLQRKLKAAREELERREEGLRRAERVELQLGVQLEEKRESLEGLNAERKELLRQVGQLTQGLIGMREYVGEVTNESRMEREELKEVLERSHQLTEKVISEGIDYLDAASQQIEQLDLRQQ